MRCCRRLPAVPPVLARGHRRRRGANGPARGPTALAGRRRLADPLGVRMSRGGAEERAGSFAVPAARTSRRRSSQPSLSSLWLGMLVHPRGTARVVAASPLHRAAWTAVVGFAGLYSIATLTAQLMGRRPSRSPLMRVLPAARYYAWETVFQPPVTVAWTALFAALVRAGAKRCGGRGTYRSDFDQVALGHTIPLVVAMWLPDMVCYLLRLDEWRYRRLVAGYAPLATAWALAVTVTAVAEGESISWPRAAVLVTAADAASALATGIPLVMR